MEAPAAGEPTKTVPAPPAQFLGSFAPGSRQDDRVAVVHEDVKSQVQHYLTHGWDDISIWKAAFIELIGSMSLCYLSALLTITFTSFKTLHVAPYVGITNVFIITLFIYALSPASGGHINPVITFATMTAGLTSFSRGFLYLIGQTIGGAVAGGLIRGSFGEVLTVQYGGGGCDVRDTSISEGQIFLIEAIMTFILLFLSFGVGLDPRQAKLYGPKIGPFLTACVLGLLTFASAGLAPGYPGAGMNPARCFAYAVARKDFTHQWIWWVGPLTGSLLQTTVYHIVPPYHYEKCPGGRRAQV